MLLFRIKRETQLKKLMQAYCDREGYQMKNIRFEFDGAFIAPEETPSQVIVYVHVHFNNKVI